MFEHMTYEYLLDQALAMGKELGVDTRQGSIYYDAAAGHCLRTAKFYTDLEQILNLTQLDTATGEALDAIGRDHAMYRNEAIEAKWRLVYSGTRPRAGIRFMADGYYFVLVEEQRSLYLVAEQAGAAPNNAVVEGSPCIPLVNIPGLTSATMGEMVNRGVDAEADEPFRERIRYKISESAENGNKAHYKAWCEDVAGVGRAKVFPLWAGENTVMAVIFDMEGKLPLPSLVQEVQHYVDPITTGYTVEVGGVSYVMGDGLGEGVANIGAHFLAVGATGVMINIETKVVLRDKASLEDATEAIKKALEAEFSDMALKSMETGPLEIRYHAVGAVILSIDTVLDYSELTINGGMDNIPIGEEAVGVLGEVDIRI